MRDAGHAGTCTLRRAEPGDPHRQAAAPEEPQRRTQGTALLSLQPQDMPGDIEQRQSTALDVVLAIEDDERRQQLAGMLAAMKLHARCWQ